MNPCTELETRGGVWRYDAKKTNQVFSPKERYATGIRNGEGFAVDAIGHHIFVTQHGRDQLHTNWPDVIKDADKEATLPSEEVLLLQQGGDYGWPMCYHDPFQPGLVLAPEYGGDGKTAGLCAQKIPPWPISRRIGRPTAWCCTTRNNFPPATSKGLFIAFHGSWNRAPYAQGGYNVVYQALSGDKASGKCEIFADGFAGADKSPDKAAHRPDGLAVGPDGALFVTDDVAGRIYRIVYKGGADAHMRQTVPCPSATDSPGSDRCAPKPAAGRHASRRRLRQQRADGAAGRDAGHGGPRRSRLSRPGRRRDLHRMPRRRRKGFAAGSGPHRQQMAVEQRQLCGHRRDHCRRCRTAEELSFADAGDGRSAAQQRSGHGRVGLHLGAESPRRCLATAAPATSRQLDALARCADRQQLLEEAADLTRAIDEVNLQNPMARQAVFVGFAQLD